MTIIVGTTGDYRPLTFLDPKTKQFSGRDIELVEAFTSDEGLGVTFVPTTWSSMMSDLTAGKFAMAVGGISRTPDRAKQALTSISIEKTGKAPLVRCEDKMRYSTLSRIDRSDVTVVENRGGTNEAFARDRLRNAHLVIVDDNVHPFEYLRQRRADIFFTDTIEAVYAEELGIGLCAIQPDQPLTQSEKVFLFAKDQNDLRDRFDRWISNRQT